MLPVLVGTERKNLKVYLIHTITFRTIVIIDYGNYSISESTGFGKYEFITCATHTAGYCEKLRSFLGIVTSALIANSAIALVKFMIAIASSSLFACIALLVCT